MIEIGNYVTGFEKTGISGIDQSIKQIKGWIDRPIMNYQTNTIIGYEIQADDNYKGHRGTGIMYEYGDIQVISTDKERLLLSNPTIAGRFRGGIYER